MCPQDSQELRVRFDALSSHSGASSDTGAVRGSDVAPYDPGQMELAAQKLIAFLSKGRFIAVATTRGGAAEDLEALMADEKGRQITLPLDIVKYTLEKLAKPGHKYLNAQGDFVTKYPDLVLALKQAEKDLELYARPEMRHLLKGRAAQSSSNSLKTRLRLL
jgi:hypothetical protein